MEKFIDIHCHLLPGVDDGAGSMDDAVALLKMAWEDGTGTLVLTPHYRGHYRRNTPQQLRETFAALCAQAPEGMELYLGCEVGYEPEVWEKLTEGRVLTIHGGRYVLLELSVGVTGPQAVQAVREIAECGFVPIIAHIERYPVFQRDKALVGAVLDQGALVQINADSIMGRWGFGAKRFCRWLLARRLAHFVASDSHDAQERPPKLAACYRYICEKYGEDYAAALFWNNARVVLAQDKESSKDG